MKKLDELIAMQIQTLMTRQPIQRTVNLRRLEH